MCAVRVSTPTTVFKFTCDYCTIDLLQDNLFVHIDKKTQRQTSRILPTCCISKRQELTRTNITHFLATDASCVISNLEPARGECRLSLRYVMQIEHDLTLGNYERESNQAVNDCALMITTSSMGLSPGPVLTFPIFCTTSMPSTTWPKTVCLPFR